MSITPKGKVPHFKMRPDPVASFVCIIIFVSGSLISLSFFSQEDGTGIYQQKGIICALITALLTFLLILVAIAKFWFTHLWKKNATHGRHHQHSQQHPAEKDKEFRKWLDQKRNQKN
jgi:formate hydrogenlyase subunit 3/multisubunit Na+/H+ antiporter MnhD subunit